MIKPLNMSMHQFQLEKQVRLEQLDKPLLYKECVLQEKSLLIFLLVLALKSPENGFIVSNCPGWLYDDVDISIAIITSQITSLYI